MQKKEVWKGRKENTREGEKCATCICPCREERRRRSLHLAQSEGSNSTPLQTTPVNLAQLRLQVSFKNKQKQKLLWQCKGRGGGGGEAICKRKLQTFLLNPLQSFTVNLKWSERWLAASLVFHRGCVCTCVGQKAPWLPSEAPPPPPLPQSHPHLHLLRRQPSPHLVRHPAKKSPATNGGDLFSAPQGERLMVNNTPTLPTHQCVGYPVAPIPGWLASILPFNPCVGSITPPLVMALMPVHPALAGK